MKTYLEKQFQEKTNLDGKLREKLKVRWESKGAPRGGDKGKETERSKKKEQSGLVAN